MKKLLASVVLFAALFSSSSFAGEIKKIAVINIEKVSGEAKVVKYIASKISDQRDEYQKEIRKTEEKLEEERKTLDSKRNILSQEELQKQQKDFVEKVNGLKELAAKREKSLQKAFTDAIKEVNDKVVEVVADIAKEQKLDLVLSSSQVVFTDASHDITDEVIDKLNKKVKKVKVKF